MELIGRLCALVLSLVGFVVVLFAKSSWLASWHRHLAGRDVNLRDWGAQVLATGIMLSVALDNLPHFIRKDDPLGMAVVVISAVWIVYGVIGAFLSVCARTVPSAFRPSNKLAATAGIAALAANFIIR